MEVNQEQVDLVLEYALLAARCQLSELEGKRMSNILELAQEDDIICFLINEVDYFICSELGLLDEENLHYYKNQEARIKEFIGVKLESDLVREASLSLGVNYHQKVIEKEVVSESGDVKINKFNRAKELAILGGVVLALSLSLLNVVGHYGFVSKLDVSVPSKSQSKDKEKAPSKIDMNLPREEELDSLNNDLYIHIPEDTKSTLISLRKGNNNTLNSNKSIISSETEANIGDVYIDPTSLILENGSIISASTASSGNWGQTGRLRLRDESQVSVGISGIESGGTLKVQASEVELSGRGFDDQISRVFADAKLGTTGNEGKEKIDILTLNHPETPSVDSGDLSLVSDVIISGDAHFAGSAGNLVIRDAELVELNESNIITQTMDVQMVEGKSNSGTIRLSTKHLSLESGSIVSTLTSQPGSGNGGDIAISEPISASSFSSGDAGDIGFLGIGAEASGNLTIISKKGNVDTSAGTLITNSAIGKGGEIDLQAAQNLTIGTISAISNQSTGGRISLKAGEGNNIFSQGNITTNDNSIIFKSSVIITNNIEIAVGRAGEIRFGETIDGNHDLNLGTAVNGTTNDNLCFELPDEIANADISKDGNQSEFVIVGNGGTPSTIEQAFTSDSVEVDLVEPILGTAGNQSRSNPPSPPDHLLLPTPEELSSLPDLPPPEELSSPQILRVSIQRDVGNEEGLSQVCF